MSARGLLQVLRRVALPALFIFMAVRTVVGLTVVPELVMIDAHVYVRAGTAWLSGGDPWFAPYLGVVFAAPPPTLLPFGLLSLLGEDLAVPVVEALGVLAAIAALRLLHLPWWWILWPPLLDALIVGNPDAWLPALLATGAVGTGVAAFGKIYAVVPAGYELRWTAIAVTIGLLLATAPVLPWGAFLARASEISETFSVQTGPGLSAFGAWPLAALACIALLVMDRRDAALLLVPALWPTTQLHYASLALPLAARSPLAAIGLALHVPGAPAWTAIILAVIAVVLRRRAGLSGLRMWLGILGSPPAQTVVT